MYEQLTREAQDKMAKAVDAVDKDLKSLRTGRATTAMLEGIVANVYGTNQPLNQVATVTTPDAATVAVQPWDAGNIAAIEKAIIAANLGIMPTNDGKMIRLRVPPLTEESRKEIVKKAHHGAEQGRIAIRNVRRHVNDEVKKHEKEHEISEDDKKRLLDLIQKKTDEHIKKVDEVLARKEIEIMRV